MLVGAQQRETTEAQEKLDNTASSAKASADLLTRKTDVMTQARKLIAAHKYAEAKTVLAPYGETKDIDLNQLSDQIDGLIEASELEERKRFLLGAIKIVHKEDYGRLAEIYAELRELDPSHGEYAELATKYGALFDAQQRIVVERERRRNLGTLWKYETHLDDMSGGKVRYAAVRSSNEFEFKFPYQGAQRASLVVRQHPRWGLNVYVNIERGQFLPCFTDDCTAVMRFDDGPSEQVGMDAPTDMDATIRFLRSPENVLNRLRKSRTVRIEVPFFNEGNRILTFEVDGLDLPS